MDPSDLASLNGVLLKMSDAGESNRTATSVTYYTYFRHSCFSFGHKISTYLCPVVIFTKLNAGLKSYGTYVSAAYLAPRIWWILRYLPVPPVLWIRKLELVGSEMNNYGSGSTTLPRYLFLLWFIQTSKRGPFEIYSYGTYRTYGTYRYRYFSEDYKSIVDLNRVGCILNKLLLISKA